MDLRPTEIKRMAGELAIHWTTGDETRIQCSAIRLNCACAICKEIKVPLTAAQPYFQRAIALQTMKVVGNYALEILWGDGHRSIVPFSKLHDLKNIAQTLVDDPAPIEIALPAVEVEIDPSIMTKEKTCGCGRGGCGAKSQ